MRLKITLTLRIVNSKKTSAMYSFSIIFFIFFQIIGSKGQISPTITHGMIIEASSIGSSMNVFTWPERLFDLLPSALTFPTYSKRMNERLLPALYTYADHPEDVWEHLEPLIQYAKDKLIQEHDRYSQFPIFLKATAGLRILPPDKRSTLMKAIQTYLSDPTKNPFYFEPDYARVISGEEEAAYGWTTVNFITGVLKMRRVGFGPISADRTYGSVDIGGHSASIGFYLEDQNILSNLFKLQFADSAHWNIYTHSHIWYGVYPAHDRLRWNLIASHNAGEQVDVMGLLSDAVAKEATDGTFIMDPCLPANYMMEYTIHGTLYYMVGNDQGANWTACREESIKLLNTKLNYACYEQNDQACSFCGTYQPPLPRQDGSHGQFFGFEAYADLWDILYLPSTSSLTKLEEEAATICSYSMEQLEARYASLSTNPDASKWAPEDYCFLASYALTLLHDGYGFGMNRTLTCKQTVNNLHISWALGAMIYEINALPWVYTGNQRWIQYGLLFTLLAITLTALLVNSVSAILSHGTRVRAMTEDPITEILRSNTSLCKLRVSSKSIDRYGSVQEALNEK